MRRQIRNFLSLWLLLFLCFTVHAADWPATLYMAQSSFSSTGRQTATGVDGVYEFSIYYSSSTAAPKYYIFTTASSASNAKKGTFQTFGASATTDGTNIQPDFGKKYNLVDISTAEDAETLTSEVTISSFMPIYARYVTVNVKVDLNDMSVVFTRDPEEAVTTTLSIFNKDTSAALANTTVDADGKAKYSIKMSKETNIYFSANNTVRANSQDERIWGSSSQTDPKNVVVEKGTTYPMPRATYYQVYSMGTCSFTLPAGNYDIIADINTGEVEFAEFTGKYRSKPATLNMRNNTFATSYGSATGTNGIYKFTFDKSGSYTSEPFRIVFTEATSLSTARNASWVLGSTTDDTNVTPLYGKAYPLVDINPDNVCDNYVGSFLPLYPESYEVVVDLNEMTVTFNPLIEPDPLTTLNILNNTFGVVASAQKGTDGKFHYSYRGAEGTQVFFSTVSSKAAMQKSNAVSFGAGGHADPKIETLEIGKTFAAPPISYRRIVTDMSGFFILPGKCDLTLDPETNTLTVEEYTGKYIAFPTTLYMRPYTFSTTAYASATGENGVYTLEFDREANITSEPYRAVFTDATSISTARTAAWVLGATTEATNITPEYGKAYPLVDVNPDNVNNTITGTFMPIYPQIYDVVVDLKNMTVVFNPKADIDNLDTLNILNENFKVVATAEKDENGDFGFSFRGKEGTKVFFSTASSANDMKTTAPLSYGAGGHAAPLLTETEYDNTYETLPISYRRIYSDKTGMFELPGKCDIVFNADTKTFSVKPYTGKYDVYPEELYLKLNTLSSTIYATAKNEDGIYTFEYTTQTYNNSPRNLVFSDITTSSQATPASWVLGASADGSTVNAYPGLEAPLYDVNYTDVMANQSYFTPFYPYTYTITVDLKNRTVKWGEPAPAPTSLRLLDDYYDVISSGGANSDGVYTIEALTYSSHPLFFAEAESDAELRQTPWIFTTSTYGDTKDINIADGLTTPVERSTYYSQSWWGGYWKTPEGCNKIVARVDINNNNVEWSVTPFSARETEVLYMINSNMEPLSHVVSDNSGIYDFDVTLTSSSYVGFSDSNSDKNDPGRVFYGSCVPYNGKRVVPESGTEYSLYFTSSSAIRDARSTYYLAKGRWRVHVNMNDNTISFEDITRGGTWYVPENVSLCDDDLNVIATPSSSEDGVFTFSNIAIESEKGLKKVVLLDTAEGGSIFGANATGDQGPNVVSSQAYDLYMPEKTWVVTDGASCFGLTPATYNITVNFNEKTIVFVDPSIPIYPDKMRLIIPGDQPATVSTVSGDGVYTFELDNSAAISVVITDPDTGIIYEATEAGFVATNGAEIAVGEFTAPQPSESEDTEETEEPAETVSPVSFTIPEGFWTVEFNYADMKVTFNQTPRPVFVSTTMPSETPFYSYFGVGTDSKAVFTFNNDLKSVKAIYVVLGNYDGGIPVENETTALGLRTASISENKLIVGFTGQHYEIPEGADQKVHIVLSTIVDTYGHTLVTDAVSGLPAGSLVFEYPFKEFQRIAIEGKSDPKTGSDIDNLSTVWMYVNHFDDITFDNVIFAEDKSTSEAPMYAESESGDTTDAEPARKYAASWERGKTNSDGFTEMIIDVPMGARGLGNLRLYLENLSIDDAYTDHESDVNAKFFSKVDPTLEVTATPEDGTTVGRIDNVLLTWTHHIISSAGNLASKASFVNTATGETIDATYSYPASENTLLVTPESPIEEKGTYKLTIGKGDIVFNDDMDAVNNPLEFNFTVDPSLGINSVVISETDDVEVVDLSGILVRKGKGRHVLEGLSGIYIVNGVKCLLTAGSSNTKLSK